MLYELVDLITEMGELVKFKVTFTTVKTLP